MTASSMSSPAPAKNSNAPFMSVKELRKVLGNDAKELSDEKIQKLSVGLGKIASLLVNNPKIFNNLIKVKGDQNEQIK